MKSFYIFICAVAVTFGFIAMLQFVPFPWFFLALVCMHFGVFLFIFSKKRFVREGYDVSSFYSTEYKLLALYLPILAAKLMSSFGLFYFDSTLKTVLIAIVTVFSVIVSAFNAKKLYNKIKDQESS
ncbi:MAG: hypothetical protein IJE84_01695 [Clostridia bacterium]|nr:hypothetical protein [Clostridia bacterium]